MADVAPQLEAAARDADAEVTWSDLPVVRGEEALLATLLANLIGNSLKFRRPDVPPRVHVSAPPGRTTTGRSRVQDNGIGIETEFADKVFVIFQRLHAARRLPGHRHRAGRREEDRRVPRRPDLDRRRT